MDGSTDRTASDRERTEQRSRAVQTRERIVASARQLVSEHGPLALTTTAVAVHAGLSVGTVYRYFDDRDAILVLLYHRNVEAVRRALLRAVEPTGRTLGEDIEAVVRMYALLHRTLPGYQGIRAYVSLLPGMATARRRAIRRLAQSLVTNLAYRHDVALGREAMDEFVRAMETFDAVLLGDFLDGAEAEAAIDATCAAAVQLFEDLARSSAPHSLPIENLARGAARDSSPIENHSP